MARGPYPTLEALVAFDGIAFDGTGGVACRFVTDGAAMAIVPWPFHGRGQGFRAVSSVYLVSSVSQSHLCT
jgi:hypothetical protein